MKTYNTPNTTISAMAAQSLLMSSPTPAGMTVGGGSNNPLQGPIGSGDINGAMAPSRKF